MNVHNVTLRPTCELDPSGASETHRRSGSMAQTRVTPSAVTGPAISPGVAQPRRRSTAALVTPTANAPTTMGSSRHQCADGSCRSRFNRPTIPTASGGTSSDSRHAARRPREVGVASAIGAASSSSTYAAAPPHVESPRKTMTGTRLVSRAPTLRSKAAAKLTLSRPVHGADRTTRVPACQPSANTNTPAVP